MVYPAVNSSTGFALKHDTNDEVFFVYGTLKKGEYNHRMMTGAEYVGQASVPGKLYISGWGLPCYIMGDEGTVYGEVYRGTKGMLSILDRFEGYHEDDLNESFYIRSRVTCTLADGTTIDAWVYEYNHPVDEGRRRQAGVF